MTMLLNGLADLAYRLRYGRAPRLAFALGMIISIGLISLARVEDDEAMRIIPFDADSSPVALLNRYVSVAGVLITHRAFQTEVAVGGLKLSGARYVPLLVEGASDPLPVLDERLPQPGLDGRVQLIGKIQEGSAQVPYYLQVGEPPNIPLQNALAQLGIAGAVLLLTGAFVVWWIGRADYALAVGRLASTPQPTSAGIGALWFGSLGAGYGRAVVRAAPVAVVEAAHEIRLDGLASQPPWSVHIRDVCSVRPVHIATAFGVLPGARIVFQDERGLSRHGTLVLGGDVHADAVLRAWLDRRIN